MELNIDKKRIGDNYPVFIIAELSANHNQDFNIAVKTIKAAKKAGADAIKLQTYTADTLTLDSDNECFKIKGGLWDGKTLYELYKEAYTPWEWQPELKKIAEKEGLICFSSPFDKSAVDFLEKMDVPAYKIASFEITDIPLIEYIASKGKPVIISTGIATFDEIKDAIKACKKQKNNQIALLKCTSVYPSSLEDINLNMIPEFSKRFEIVVGLSDHTLGTTVPVAAVALGARIIEKHLILDKKLRGPDAAFSLEPAKFKKMVERIRKIEKKLGRKKLKKSEVVSFLGSPEFKEIVKGSRDVEKAMGKVSYEINDKIKKSRMFARSLFIVENVNEGDVITEKNVRSIRPNNGLPPKYLKNILGKKIKKNAKKGTPLSWDLIE